MSIIAIIFVIPFIIALVQIGMALAAGIKIWRLSAFQTGPRRTTLRLLAFNLIEPAVNTALISLLLFVVLRTFLTGGLIEWIGVPFAIAVTLPVGLLLLPFAWATSPDPLARSVNLKLGVLGLARWAVTALAFVMPYAMPLGLLALGFSLRWVKRQAYQTIGAHDQAIGLGPEGVMVGERGDFSASIPPDIRT